MRTGLFAIVLFAVTATGGGGASDVVRGCSKRQ